MFDGSDSCKCISFREEWMVISKTTASINIFWAAWKEGGWEKSTIFNQEQINTESQSEM